jgi:hypothetical protein
VLLTDYYKSVLEQEHANGEWGVASVHYAPRVANMMKRYNLNEVLDYGAGAGNLEKTLKTILPDVIVYNYEPGIPKWNIIPSPCKMVACIDVIEHIEPECIDSVLDDLERVIEGYAFISISTTLANRVLNNGWNAHICLKDPQEWKEIFERRFQIICPGMYDGGVEIEICRRDLNENI